MPCTREVINICGTSEWRHVWTNDNGKWWKPGCTPRWPDAWSRALAVSSMFPPSSSPAPAPPPRLPATTSYPSTVAGFYFSVFIKYPGSLSSRMANGKPSLFDEHVGARGGTLTDAQNPSVYNPSLIHTIQTKTSDQGPNCHSRAWTHKLLPLGILLHFGSNARFPEAGLSGGDTRSIQGSTEKPQDQRHESERFTASAAHARQSREDKKIPQLWESTPAHEPNASAERWKWQKAARRERALNH